MDDLLKCGSCGGSGRYPDKGWRNGVFVTEEVACKKCEGSGKNPIISAMYDVIVEANNELYGSQGFFLTTAKGEVVGAIGVTDPPDKYHLGRKIGQLKMQANRDYNRAQQLESLLCEAREVIRKTGGGDAILNEIDDALTSWERAAAER
jgi:hypothetical protein